MTTKHDYGLELTNNSKVGWAFSLPRSKTCVNATNICKKLCYGNGIRYQSEPQRAKRERNYRTVELLLAEGGAELLAENLRMLVDQARPRDWFSAKVTGTKGNTPWTLRIHDVGDFHSVEYVRAWQLAAEKRIDCRFWFYTRSFVQAEMLAAMTELAGLKNCQGWLSADAENYDHAILAKCSGSFWKLALLQDKALDESVGVALASGGKVGEVVNFPYHRSGHHVVPLKQAGITTCPVVIGTYQLQSASSGVARPCQVCAFCLP